MRELHEDYEAGDADDEHAGQREQRADDPSLHGSVEDVAKDPSRATKRAPESEALDRGQDDVEAPDRLSQLEAAGSTKTGGFGSLAPASTGSGSSTWSVVRRLQSSPGAVAGDGTNERTGIRSDGWDTKAPPRREQLVELGVFLSLIVPSMVLELFVLRRGGVGFSLVALSTIVRNLSLVALVRFFVWRNGEPAERLGWRWKRRTKDAALGVLLFPLFFFLSGLISAALRAAGLSAPDKAMSSLLIPTSTAQVVLACVLVPVVAFSEETLFRGYLILRLRSLTRSRAAVALLSSAIFSLGHFYEGASGAVTVGLMGVVFAVLYLWRRSLVAPMVLHFLQDFVSIVILR